MSIIRRHFKQHMVCECYIDSVSLVDLKGNVVFLVGRKYLYAVFMLEKQWLQNVTVNQF